jgi:rhodanese-related sulfurtransferase
MEFLLKEHNWMWALFAAISGGMLLWPTFRGGGATGLSPLHATQKMNKDAVVVDVRDPEEFARGHIINARNIPAKELESRSAELQKFKNKPVIVVCEKGMQGGDAASRLRKLGFEQAVRLEGGLAAWRTAGLPLTK